LSELYEWDKKWVHDPKADKLEDWAWKGHCLGYNNESNRMRVLNSTTSAMRVEQDIIFAKFLNFKEEEKSENEIWYKSSPISSLAKLPKIPTLLATLVPLLSIETISTNLPANNSTIEAIHKPIYKKIQPIANKCPYYLQNPS